MLLQSAAKHRMRWLFAQTKIHNVFLSVKKSWHMTIYLYIYSLFSFILLCTEHCPSPAAMPRCCKGFQDREPCRFEKDGNQAQPKPRNARWSWCDQGLLRQVCDSIGGRHRLQQVYKKFTPEVAELARSRLPAEVRWSFPTSQPPNEAIDR